jgi:hypothetical protein
MNEVDKLKKVIETIEKDLHFAKRLVASIEESNKKNYREVPGVEGVFDGLFLISADGQKYGVPENYSAKSRLVFGDTLKMIEDEGKQLFKQIARVERKKVEGVINKKEGKWHVLAETGSYRLNDKAVEFNSLSVNDKVAVLIPADNLNAPYAALDKVLFAQNPRKDIKDTKDTKEPVGNERRADSGDKDTTPPVSREKKDDKALTEKEGNLTLKEETPKKKNPPAENPPKRSTKKKKEDREYVNQIGDEEKKPVKETGKDAVSELLSDDDLR